MYNRKGDEHTVHLLFTRNRSSSNKAMSTPSRTYVLFTSLHGDGSDDVSTFWGNSEDIIEQFLSSIDGIFSHEDMKMMRRNRSTLVEKISSTDVDFNVGRIYDGDLYNHIMISSRESTAVVEIAGVGALYKFFGVSPSSKKGASSSKKNSLTVKAKSSSKKTRRMSSSEEESGSESGSGSESD